MTETERLNAIQVPHSRASAVLARHEHEGRDLLANAASVVTERDFHEWDNVRKRWIALTTEALKAIFSTSAAAEEFATATSPHLSLGAGGGVSARFKEHKEHVDRATNVLVSLQERLEYLDEVGPAPETSAGETDSSAPRRIFIVHGRNNARKLQVARLLERTGTDEVVILHEQPSQGRTLIEKFEAYASKSDYAVVLLTADDVGSLAGSPDLQARARQNVVFELGYFVGVLGRSNVCSLYEPEVELPSDFQGVVYVELDPGGAWESKLLLELRGAGFTYNLNKLV